VNEGPTDDWGIYARRSIKGDSPVSRSVELQVEQGVLWIKARGGSVKEAHIYKDDGVSGALFLGRPEFQRMRRDTKAGAVGKIAFFDLDRFGRDSRHTMEALHALADIGVEVWDYSTGQRVDLDSFEGRVTATLRAEFAQQYVETIRKKVRFTMRAKAGRGEWCGGRPYGYRNVVIDRVKTLEIIPAEAKVVIAIYKRFAADAGLHEIMRWLNDSGIPSPWAGRVRNGQTIPNASWSAPMVRHILRRAIYRGWYEYAVEEVRWGRATGKPGRERAQVRRPEGPASRVEKSEWRIVPEELASRVDARLLEDSRIYAESRGTGKAPHKSWGRHLLSGILVCPECGAGFQVSWTGTPGRKVYTCGGRDRRSGSCNSRIRLPLEEADRAILSTLEREVLGGRLIDELLSLVEATPPDEAERLTAERGRLHDNVQRLVKAIAEGAIAPDTAGQNDPRTQREHCEARCSVRVAERKRPGAGTHPGPP
jgi:DNA invertase Pin-like site-specific DNA recombinase